MFNPFRESSTVERLSQPASLTKSKIASCHLTVESLEVEHCAATVTHVIAGASCRATHQVHSAGGSCALHKRRADARRTKRDGVTSQSDSIGFQSPETASGSCTTTSSGRTVISPAAGKSSCDRRLGERQLCCSKTNWKRDSREREAESRVLNSALDPSIHEQQYGVSVITTNAMPVPFWCCSPRSHSHTKTTPGTIQAAREQAQARRMGASGPERSAPCMP